MVKAYISAGSNLGSREDNLRQAISALQLGGAIVTKVSSAFETEPVGYLDQPWFLNIAVEVETHLSPQELMKLCHETEMALGRIRTFQGAPRKLDLDILLYGDQIVEESGLKIPHPRMANRRFVLEPLAQIAAEVVHAVSKETIRHLLEKCTDSAAVHPFSSGDLR
jgi:2-amino-4-hydroxy-6-hydroxymethyldihydropteridine diphosphokinase